jgi:outer membrane protein OmpA-like peptidoglycan-associated protein
MAKDWASDVKKFAPDADDGVIAGIVRYCGIALQKPDSSLVSYTDPTELGRVRNNFLKKKLALTDPDDVLDAAIARVGERMKGVNFKNRVTVYYLLLEDLGLTHLFAKKGSATATGSVAASVAAAGAVAAVAAATAAPKKAAAPRKPKVAATPAADVSAEAPVMAMAAVAAPATVAAVTGVPLSDTISSNAGSAAHWGMARAGIMPSVEGPGVTPGRFGGGDDDGKPVWGWLWLTLAALAVMALFVLLLPRGDRSANDATASAPAEVADNAMATSPATTAPTPAPDGAGIVSETREAKPVVKVYFDTGKADVAPTFAIAAEPLKAWLAANAGSKIGVSGYNDPSGNAAANAALSKRRAQAVQAALVSAGVAAGSIELVKPEAATDSKTTAAEARRVEVYIK